MGDYMYNGQEPSFLTLVVERIGLGVLIIAVAVMAAKACA
jgi:hypothetical protein